jgi:RimJ/RimL family protein N-acetyltransferase
VAVTLRDWKLDDIPIYRRWLEPGHEWQSWDGPYLRKPTVTESDVAAARLTQRVVRGEWPTPRRQLVIAAVDTDELLGTVSWYFEAEESDWRRMGIVLYDPGSWSGGLGTEALALWTDYLFAHTDLVRLDFATWSGNIGMCRIGQKLGFTEEARFRQARLVRGERYDSVVYGVLRSEWRPTTPRATP